MGPQFLLEGHLQESWGLGWSWALLFPQNLARAGVWTSSLRERIKISGRVAMCPARPNSNYPGKCSQRCDTHTRVPLGHTRQIPHSGGPRGF